MAKIVEKTNPLTGAVEYVDQLDHTAQEVDDGIDRAFLVQGQNLLDNSVFLPGCLVDQRQGYVVVPGSWYVDEWGAEASGHADKYYTAIHAPGGYDDQYQITVNGETKYVHISSCVRGYTGAGMTVDRWATTGSVIIADGMIQQKESGQLYQHIENLNSLIGRKLTFSALLSDHSLLTGSWTFADESIDVAVADDIILAYNTAYQFMIYARTNSPRGIKASALNLGDHQTAFHKDGSGKWQLNELPRYGDTLARCQRSACKLFDISNYGRAGIVVAEGSDIAHLYIPTPVTMRAIPSLQFLHGSISDLYIERARVYTAISGVSCINKCAGYLDILLNTSGLTEGNVYTIRAKDNRVCLFATSEL